MNQSEVKKNGISSQRLQKPTSGSGVSLADAFQHGVYKAVHKPARAGFALNRN